MTIQQSVDKLVEQLKFEHLIYHDPNMVKRVRQLLAEAFCGSADPVDPVAPAPVPLPVQGIGSTAETGLAGVYFSEAFNNLFAAAKAAKAEALRKTASGDGIAVGRDSAPQESSDAKG
jgi:hypothetical protein